jgi:hypothetical protein
VDGVPTLPLASCTSNNTAGALTPVSKFIADLRSLKTDPDHQILVAGLVGPPAPYVVEWLPAVGGTVAGELWPRVAPSCGAEAVDGSGAFGEPGIRIAEFVNGFSNGFLGSVCDANYAEVLSPLCRDGEGWAPPCLSATNIQPKTDAEGRSYPDCVATEQLTAAGVQHHFFLPPCATVAAGEACWALGAAGSGHCPAGEEPFTVSNEPVGPDPANYNASVLVSCQLTPPADAGSCPD